MHFIIRKIFLAAILLLLISAYGTKAQTGTVRGFVYEKETGEPLLFTAVYLKGTTYGITTDENGYYSITKIPPGDYVLTVTLMGYDTVETPVKLLPGEIITRKLYVNRSGIDITAVEISAEKQEKETEVQIAIIKVTPREIKQIPSVGGEPDIAQYIQTIPGVVFTGDQGGQLYIRGGTPIQNKVLLDGMVVYNPFHSIGFFSVFDTDIIRNADVYTGGFGAEYGGRISSVMDISTRDGNKKRFSGKLSANPFTSKLLFEGPIVKQKEESGGSTSFIATAKSSYLDKTSKTLYEYIDTSGLPYRYNDYYGKLVLSNVNGSKLNLFGFRFTDDVDYRLISRLNWKSTGFGSSFVLIPGNTPVLIDGNFAWSQYKIELAEADEQPRSSLINGFNLGLNFMYYLARNEIKYGVELLGFKTNFQFSNYLNYKLEQEENTSEISGYFLYKRTAKRWVIEPSLRIHYYASLSEFSPEPRIGVKFNAAPFLRLKAAGGIYAQNLFSTVSDRDVVNLFYGFLSSPENLQDEFKGKKVNSRLQRAAHLLAGIEADLPKRISLNAEGYVKFFSQLANINRDKIYADVPANSSIPDYLKKDFILEEGIAYGTDLLLKYNYRRYYFWAVYSLAFVTRDDGIREYVPHFDRRHTVNIVASYTFGKDLLWEADVRWNFGSGFPFTRTAGYYEHLTLQDGLNTNVAEENGQFGILYDALNEGRLPYYHRLDFSVKKTFVLGNNSNLEIIASVINAYDRRNIFYFDRIRYQRVNQLPVLPSLGVSFTF